MSDRSPSTIWDTVADVREWQRLLRYPGRPPIRRVKLESGPQVRTDARLQVLFDDLGWTRYRIIAWQPAKRIELLALEQGVGEAEGDAPTLPWSERLLLIPQGNGAEIEWSVKFLPRGLGRLLAPLAVPKESWQDALEARVAATA